MRIGVIRLLIVCIAFVLSACGGGETTAKIQKLYVAYFGRPADVAGLAYWTTVVTAANGDTSAVSAEFAKSAEYKAMYVGMNNDQIVNAVYVNLFGRNAEDAGRKYWAQLLNTNQITIDNVVTAVAAGAQNSDLIAINGKVQVAIAFTSSLDNEKKKDSYNGSDAIKFIQNILATVTSEESADNVIVMINDHINSLISFALLGAKAGVFWALFIAMGSAPLLIKFRCSTALIRACLRLTSGYAPSAIPFLLPLYVYLRFQYFRPLSLTHRCSPLV